MHTKNMGFFSVFKGMLKAAWRSYDKKVGIVSISTNCMERL